MCLWVGIDEVGYGPNLGPFVMCAVVVKSENSHPPNLWEAGNKSISKSGGPEHALWIDDSKKLYQARRGRDRLEAALWTALDALGRTPSLAPTAFFEAVGQLSLQDAELVHWIDPPMGYRDPRTNPYWRHDLPTNPFKQGPWVLQEILITFVGPYAFNTLLEQYISKATLHFESFISLVKRLPNDTSLSIHSDQHSGRRHYDQLLAQHFPESLVEILPSQPGSRSFQISSPDSHVLNLRFSNKADSSDGLVALASMVGKSIREIWMDHFNHFWMHQVPGLRPTAGYPVDAQRFRKDIEHAARELGIHPSRWWRER